MNPKDIILKFAKYKVPKFEIEIPGYDEPFKVADQYIGNFSIEKDFRGEFLFPYIEFRVMVPDYVYKDIMQASENIYCNVQLQYGYFDDPTETTTDAVLNASYADIFNCKFYAEIDNTTPKMTDGTNASQLKLQDDMSGDMTQYSYENHKPLVMALYIPDHIFNCNQVINDVLSKATAADAVAYYAKQLGLKKILMSPSDNPKVFDQLVIEPLPASSGLLNVVSAYGLHKKGTMVFFDYNYIYLINKKLGCTAWVNNEYKRVYLASFPKLNERSVMRSGYYANDEEKYVLINLQGNNISINNESIFEDQVIGGNILAIDSNTGKTTRLDTNLRVSDDSSLKKGKVNRVIVRDAGTADPTRDANTIEQDQLVMNIICEDVNIQALAPNREFVFTSDYARYKDYLGVYRLLTMSASFTRESQLYSVFVTASFAGGDEKFAKSMDDWNKFGYPYGGVHDLELNPD